MTLVVVVGCAGALGAVARYLTDGFVQDRSSGVFPFGTLTVNVVGSAILGLLAAFALKNARTILGTGLCGGLTTWSAASWETVRLYEEGRARDAMLFTAVNLLASLTAAAVPLVVFGS